jgi:hypothetical protein
MKITMLTIPRMTSISVVVCMMIVVLLWQDTRRKCHDLVNMAK